MNLIRKLFYRVIQFLMGTKSIPMTRFNDPSAAISQLLLKMTYKAMVDSGASLPRLSEAGFKAYSQTDEDGILLYIFSLIGTAKKQCVEISPGDGIECNTANLIINHGWHGLLIDCNRSFVERGRSFYRKHSATYVYPPTFVCAWVTRDNINTLLKDNGIEGEIDLLSLDVDGIEYWLWDALEVITPRVVVVEYQDIIGPEKSLTVPYNDKFNAYNYSTTRNMPNFSGASLLAFVKLAKKKGYRLVGCNRFGYNAFFIQNNLGEEEIPEASVHDCFKHPKVIWGMKERFPKVKDLPWIEV